MKKIALFVDVDNLVLSNSAFKEIFEEVNAAGRVVYGKVYGVLDRKHKDILDVITNYGYDMAPPMRIKKRGSKVFDHRILIDVMEMVVANEKIDTVAIACAPTDLVPLFAKMREYGVSVMTLDNLDKESRFFVDEFIGGEGSGANSGKKMQRKPAKAKAVAPVEVPDEEEEIFDEEEPDVTEEDIVTEGVDDTAADEAEEIDESVIEEDEEDVIDDLVEDDGEEEYDEAEDEEEPDEDEDELDEEDDDEESEEKALEMLRNVQKVFGGMHFDDDDEE